MAYNGYLLKIGGPAGSEFPMEYVQAETYKITPNQRQDMDPTRDTSGVLHRNVVAHRPSKIEFNTRKLYNTDVEIIMSLLRQNYINEAEKKLVLQYYVPDLNSYQTGNFYIPDIDFNIISIADNKIRYDAIRFAFIEY